MTQPVGGVAGLNPGSLPWRYTQRTLLLRNLYAGQEATVRTRHGTTDWFQIGKEYRESRKYIASIT